MADFAHSEFALYEAPHDSWPDWQESRPTPKKNFSPEGVAIKSLRIVNVPPRAAWIAEQDALNVETEFKRLSKLLNSKYLGHALLTDRLFSAEYAAVIGLGPRVVPLILRDLQKSLSPWFWALRALTRTDAASDVGAGDFGAMRASWLAWGKKNGLM